MSTYASFPLEKAVDIRMLVLDVDGVMTAGQIFLNDAGEQTKTFHVRDGHGIKMVQRAGVEVAIITGRTSKVVEHRAKELGIQRIIQGSLRKNESIALLSEQTGIPLSACAYMGDDVVDLPAMQLCALTMAPSDAHAGVLQAVDWVAGFAGGQGAIRQACEGLILGKGAWQAVMQQPYGLTPEQCAWPSD